MKHILICFAIISVLLCGCNPASTKIKEPVNFYYPVNIVEFNNASGVISQETREAHGFQNKTDLLSVYLEGPVAEWLSCPYPPDVEVISIDVVNETCTIILSKQFASITGIELTIACNCLGMTLTELFDVDTVEIKADNTILNGQKSIILSKDSFLLFDDSAGTTIAPQD